MKKYITYLKFDNLSLPELLDQLSLSIEKNKKVIVTTPNLDILRITFKDIKSRKSFNSSDFSTIDGNPILWLSRLQYKKERFSKIPGSDLTPKVLEMANRHKSRVFIFGGKEGVAKKASLNVQKKYPDIEIAGFCCPDFGFEKSQAKQDTYIQKINASKPNIVLLCTGSPKTENFFFNNYNKFYPALYLSVGATVDFLAGTIKRAPKWMNKIGLEWLYRIFKDPKRLSKRYFLDFLFLIKIIFIIIFKKKVIVKKINEN